MGEIAISRPYYLCAHCHCGQFPADTELDIVNTEFSPGVRRMQAAVTNRSDGTATPTSSGQVTFAMNLITNWYPPGQYTNPPTTTVSFPFTVNAVSVPQFTGHNWFDCFLPGAGGATPAPSPSTPPSPVPRAPRSA